VRRRAGSGGRLLEKTPRYSPRSLVCRMLGNGTEPSFGEATRVSSVGRSGGQNENVSVYRWGIPTCCTCPKAFLNLEQAG
jgi:hypothetical protein